MENIDKLPERLRYFREQKKMSRKQVCAALNITPSAICYWENGQRTPSADILLELCELYNIRSVAELFGEPKQLDKLTESEQMLLDLFRKSEKDAQIAAIELLKSW